MAKADHATPMTPREVTTRFVREWVFPRWRQLGIVLLVTAGLSAATGAYPLIIKVSFDSLLANQSGILLYILGAVVAVTLARSLFLYAQSVLSTGLIARLSTDLRKHVFRHLISLDFARLTKEAPGHSVSRLTHDVTFVETAATAALNSAIRDTLSVIVLVGTMFYLDWVMSVVVLCIYPIAAWPIISISERLRKVAKRTQSHLGDMTSGLTQIFSAPRLIKAYRLENYADRQASDAFENNFKLRMKAVRTKSQIDPMLEALGGIAVAGVIALAYWRIASGESTVGDFMGFVSALLMAAQPIRGLGSLLGRIQEGIAAGERIYGLLDTMPATAEAATAEPIKVDHGAIQFDAASFQYPNTDVPALDGVTLDIAPGTTVALVGRSGGGKSTLVNLVPRLFDVTAGRILIDGQDIRDVTIASLRDNISIVSQDVALFDDTIAENIRLGRLTATDEEIVAAAEAAAADTFIRAQPAGYETVVGDDGSRLSGGQRQRIALARAILRDAPILLLDEATSALDAESEELVQAALARLTQDRTTLVIAHRLSTVRNADVICVMDRGRIVEQGSHSELIARDGIYAGLHRTQFQDDKKAEAASAPSVPGDHPIDAPATAK